MLSSLLAQITRQLNATHAEFVTIRVPSERWLVAPLGNSRHELVERLETTARELDELARMSEALTILLDSKRPFALAAANNAEMGASAGMALAVSTASIGGAPGLSDVQAFASIGALPRPSGVARDPALAERYVPLEPGYSWHYVTSVTPRGPEFGRMFVDMWNVTHANPVEGVIVVDSVALVELLDAAGVQNVVAAGVEHPVAGLLSWLTQGQYIAFADDQAARRDAYGEIATAALGALLDNQASPTDMAIAVRELVRGRHLMIISTDPGLAPILRDAGMSGDLARDSVAVSLSNLGGNKLDSLIESSVQLTSTLIDNDDGLPAFAVHGAVTVHNTATGTEVPYIAGNRNPGRYNALLIVNVPSFVAKAEPGNPDELYAAGPDGDSYQLVFEVLLAPGQADTITFDLELPPGVDELTLEGSGRWPAMVRVSDGHYVPDQRTRITLID